MAEQEPTRSVAGGSSPSHPLQFRSAAAAPSGDRHERQGFGNLRNSGTTALVTSGFGGPVRRVLASTGHDDGRQEEFCSIRGTAFPETRPPGAAPELLSSLPAPEVARCQCRPEGSGVSRVRAPGDSRVGCPDALGDSPGNGCGNRFLSERTPPATLLDILTPGKA